MKRKILTFLVVFLFVIPFISIKPVKVNAYEVRKDVNYKLVIEEVEGNKIKVDVNVDRFEDVYGFQMYLNYNKEALKLNEITNGNVILEDTNSKVLYNRLDKENNVCYSMTKLGAHVNNKSAGTLFTVIFDKKASDKNFGIKVLNKSIISDKNGESIPMCEKEIINVGDIAISKISSENSFKLGQDAKVTIDVKNNTKETKNVTLIVALYNTENNQFVAYNAAYQKLIAGQNVELTGMMNIPQKGKYKLKALVWDTIYTMNPISRVIEIPVICE